MQTQLASELTRCEDLVRRDFRYAHLVAGASKMQMSMIWVARNQGGDVDDSDLASLRDVAWTEFVKKRFLPSVAEGTPVDKAAASMLDIVRSMNLQRRRFQIMGLHEQVEASELQFVIHLCQAGLLHTQDYRVTANRFRRHDKFFEAFALAVGAFVCSSAPFTLGAATTQYNRDLQYEYKKQTIALFVFVLQQNRGLMSMMNQTTSTNGGGSGGSLDEDYVSRIARLIIVSSAEEGGGGDGVVVVAGHRSSSSGEDGDGGGGGRRNNNNNADTTTTTTTSFIRGALDRIQRQADSMQRQSDKVERLVEQFESKVSALKDDTIIINSRSRGSGGGVVADDARIDAAVHRKFNEVIEANRRHIEKITQAHAEAERNFALNIHRIGEEYSRVSHIAQQNNENLRTELEQFQDGVRASTDLHARETRALLDAGNAEMGVLNSRFSAFASREANHAIQLDVKFDALRAELRRDNAGKHEKTMLDGGGGNMAAAGGSVTQAQLDEIKQSIGALVREELENERSRLVETVKRDVCAHVFQQIDSLLEAKIEKINPGITSAIKHIERLDTQNGQNTRQISALESALKIMQHNVLGIESLLSQLPTLVRMEDLAAVSAELHVLSNQVHELDETTSERIDALSGEWVRTLGTLQSIKLEQADSSSLSSATGPSDQQQQQQLKLQMNIVDQMERRITEQLRRHLTERMAEATPLSPPALDQSAIDSIVLKMMQNARFQRDIRGMITEGLSSHVGDNLPSRVARLEEFITSRTQTAPGFNVFSSASAAAAPQQSAMYAPAAPPP
jgi:hypothetical protein